MKSSNSASIIIYLLYSSLWSSSWFLLGFFDRPSQLYYTLVCQSKINKLSIIIFQSKSLFDCSLKTIANTLIKLLTFPWIRIAVGWPSLSRYGVTLIQLNLTENFTPYTTVYTAECLLLCPIVLCPTYILLKEFFTFSEKRGFVELITLCIQKE